jgi:CBS-domain-containing membrane protein
MPSAAATTGISWRELSQAAAAVGLAIVAMNITGTFHPPAAITLVRTA